MNRVISYIKECDGHFCDMVAQTALTVITLGVMILCVSSIA
jgi:SH3-like domain-containing protein